MRVRLGIVWFIFVSGHFLQACESRTEARKTADNFVDAYYVEYNFGRALTFAEGAAHQRVLREQRLVDEARKKMALSPASARVYYGTPLEQQAGGEAVLTYPLDIQNGGVTTRRQVAVQVSGKSGAPKVVHFHELGEAPERAGTSTGAAAKAH